DGRALRRVLRPGGSRLRTRGAARGNVVHQELDGSLDRGEHVVEVVRDAACELTHRFEALRAAKRFLELCLSQLVGPLVGDVADRAEKSLGRVVLEVEWREPESRIAGGARA